MMSCRLRAFHNCDSTRKVIHVVFIIIIRTLRCISHSPISSERFTRYNCRLKFIAYIYVWVCVGMQVRVCVCVKRTVNDEGWKLAQMNREIKEFFRYSTSRRWRVTRFRSVFIIAGISARTYIYIRLVHFVQLYLMSIDETAYRAIHLSAQYASSSLFKKLIFYLE